MRMQPSGTARVHHFMLLLCCVVLIAAGPLQAQTERQTPRLISTSGTGEVRAKPDLLEVRIGVETEAAKATDARRQNAQRAASVVAAIRKLGVPENGIRTSTFQITPVRRFPDNTPQNGTPPIVAYDVSNIVTVRTRQLDLAASIIDQAVAAGANRVDDIGFTVEDETQYRQDALKKAVSNATRDATTMAGAAGVRLGGVYSIVEGGGPVPPPIMYRSASMESSATPILPGEVRVSASVTMSWVIE